MSRKGELLYNNNNEPVAVIIGSYLSNGESPFKVRGNYYWLAVALAKYRGTNKVFGEDSLHSIPVDVSLFGFVDIPKWHSEILYREHITSEMSEERLDKAFQPCRFNSKQGTDAIISFNSKYEAASYARSITANGIPMDLPSIDFATRLYQVRYLLDEIDPTFSEYSNKSFDGLLRTSLSVWTCAIFDTIHWWRVRNNGRIGLGRPHYPSAVIPVLEIPA